MTAPDPLAAGIAAALGATDMSPLRPGGQKLVYSARLDGEPVVVKVVPLQPPHSALALERADREVKLLASIDDRRVVAVRSGLVVAGPAGAPFAAGWAEELLDGSDLTDLLGAPWPWQDAAGLLRGLAEGLALLHARDVVHRDLSPGNVRRRADGTWTLLDPGLAKHLTQTSVTGVYQPGTYGYLSPEHTPGSAPGTASDVYGAGILAFQALTGALPVDPTVPDDEYMRALREQACLAVASVRGDVPQGLAAVVDTCLDRQPARRYLDAQELLDALASLDAATGTGP